MKRLAMVLVLVPLSLMGCTHLRFENAAADVNAPTQHSGQWHHASLYGTLELSQPIDPNRLCPDGEWHSLRTEHNALALPASLLLWPLAGPSVLSMGVWTPTRVVAECQIK